MRNKVLLFIIIYFIGCSSTKHTTINNPNFSPDNIIFFGDTLGYNIIHFDTIYSETAPSILNRINPIYPNKLEQDGIEGDVFVRMLISDVGVVKAIEVSKDSDQPFIQAAVDAFMKWTFKPAMQNDKPIWVWVSLPQHFRLHNSN